MAPSSPSIPSLASSLVAIAALFFSQAAAQSCTQIPPSYPAPVFAAGYQGRILINGLRTPRGLVFDTLGNLLVTEQGGYGVRQIKLTDNGGINVCVASSKQLINDAALNHGIDLSVDGKTLYVSSKDNVFAYNYDAAAGTVTNKRTIISGMTQGGFHQSRTLLVPKKNPELLLVSRGSQDNIDSGTTQVSTGRSIIRFFETASLTSSVPFNTGGKVLGWGLRNSVGVGENPITGEIWSVENSVDDMRRNNVDVHNDNPGEELNYHGNPSNTSSRELGANYGYPDCFAAWQPSTLPSNAGISVGTQFLMGSPSGSKTDQWCQTQHIAPRLTFPSHTAPLDVKFKADGSAAFISFHGSWNRQPPDGYRVSRIEFGANGQPTAPSTSTNAAVNIMQNQNTANCPGRCFRPVGLAFDTKGRLFVASDSTNEIWIVTGA